uniref:FCH domain only protein 2 n=1 Tax=Parascaris univalens TaxID=6257 RepID=A0A915AFU2_PARUN
MVTVDYAEHFWGEKHHGYHVLYENLKQGEESVQELAQFLKDRASFEEESGKYLAKCILKTSCLSSSGDAFASSWQLTKGTLELLAEIQSSFFAALQQLLKDVVKYHEDLVRSRKRVKEQDVVDAVNLMQTTTTCLQKSKETYAQRCVELERLKKENGTSKEILKAESKVTKSRDEYRAYVDKYGRVRDEFEEKMVKAAHAFQAHDQAFLQQMKAFLGSFARVADDTAAASSQVYSQYRESIDRIDIGDIMMTFVETKGTGKDRPEVVVFEELDTVTESTTAGGTSASSFPNTSTVVHSMSQPEALPAIGHDLLGLNSNAVDAWGNARNQPSPGASDSSSSAVAAVTTPTTTNTQMPFSASLGRQKLALWLPGKRKKHASQSSLTSSEVPVNDFSHSQSESSGFLKKYISKSKKTATDLTTTLPEASSNHVGVEDAKGMTSSNKSNEKGLRNANGMVSVMDLPLASPPPLPSVPPPEELDEEGYMIRKDSPAVVAQESRWSSCTDSSDDDEEVLRAAKFRQINIRPLNESKASVNASMDELRDAIGHINLSSSINRSNTFDRDPWSATPRTTPFSLSLSGNVRPLRAAFTGDEHLRKKFSELTGSGPLPFSVSLSGGTMARARPRSNTPTLGASCLTLHSNTHPAPAPLSRRESSGSECPFPRSDSINSLGGCGPSESPFGASTSNLLSASATINEQRVPVAMAVNEYIHAWFKGTDVTHAAVRVFGTVLISFPSSAVAVLTDLNSDLEPFKFRLTSADKIKAVLPNKQLLSSEVDAFASPFTYLFERTLLAKWLSAQKADKPHAHFYNAEVLRYELRDVVAPPLLLTAYWKMEKENTDLRIDYRLNTDSAVQSALLNISFSTRVNGGVVSITADPKEEWCSAERTISWKLTELSRHGECGGSLKARLAISDGPSDASQTHVQFQVLYLTATLV